MHKKLTGRTNELILENLKRLSKLADVWVRIPVIVGINTGEMADIAEFLRGLNITKCELLAYHKLGEGKYKSFGIESVSMFDAPDDNLMNEIKALFKIY